MNDKHQIVNFRLEPAHRVLCAVIIMAALAGCDDGGRRYHYESSMRVDGLERTYIVNLPTDYYDNADAYSLVIGMHGTGGSASQFERDYGLSQKAEEAGFIVAYPDGVGSDGVLGVRAWNAGTCCDYAKEHNIDDVKFISAFIDKLVSRFRINPKRVYATGMSNGGMMAYRLACELPEKIAAIAPVSSTMVMAQPCNPSRPVPVLHMHAAIDEKVPYQGGVGLGGYYFPPVDSVLTVWATIDACGGDAVVTEHTQYQLATWENCEDNVTIECYLTDDGGHAWPGGSKPGIWADTPSKAINADDLLWEFFQRFELP